MLPHSTMLKSLKNLTHLLLCDAIILALASQEAVRREKTHLPSLDINIWGGEGGGLSKVE